MNRNRRLVFIALLAAQAVVLSLLEQAIPSPFTFAPGAKLGLANIITCVAIFKLSAKDTLLIVIIRLLLAGFLGGTLSTLLFSAAGAFLSFIGMYGLYLLGTKHISIIGISITGAVLHNIGQLSVATWVAGTSTVFLFLPPLTFFGILSGFATGTITSYLLRAMNKIPDLKS